MAGPSVATSLVEAAAPCTGSVETPRRTAVKDANPVLAIKELLSRLQVLLQHRPTPTLAPWKLLATLEFQPCMQGFYQTAELSSLTK